MNQFPRLISVLALAIVACVSSWAAGAEYRTPLSGLTMAPGGGEAYLTSDFDFGFEFRRIDSVSLAIYVPGGYGGLGVLTNGFANPSLSLLMADNLGALDVEKLLLSDPSTSVGVITIPWSPDPPPPSKLTYIRKSFSANNFDILNEPGVIVEEIEAWDLSYYNGQPEQIVPIAADKEPYNRLPDFLSSGRGEVALGAKITYLSNVLPAHPTVLPAVATAYLVIEGVEVPEPGVLPLAAMAALSGLALRREKST